MSGALVKHLQLPPHRGTTRGSPGMGLTKPFAEGHVGLGRELASEAP